MLRNTEGKDPLAVQSTSKFRKQLPSPADLIPASLSLKNRVADRIPHQFRRRTAIRPRKDILSVCFHGLLVDAEHFRNFPTVKSLGEKFDDFLLTSC